MASVQPRLFLELFTEANENDETEELTALICGAIKYLRANRFNPHLGYYTGFLCAVRLRPAAFLKDVITEVS